MPEYTNNEVTSNNDVDQDVLEIWPPSIDLNKMLLEIDLGEFPNIDFNVNDFLSSENASELVLNEVYRKENISISKAKKTGKCKSEDYEKVIENLKDEGDKLEKENEVNLQKGLKDRIKRLDNQKLKARNRHSTPLKVKGRKRSSDIEGAEANSKELKTILKLSYNNNFNFKEYKETLISVLENCIDNSKTYASRNFKNSKQFRI